MPRLTEFAGQGIKFRHSRATYPTETRVNQAALVTGCFPSRHGIVGNKFIEPVASPDKLFNTGDETELAAGDRRLGGALVGVPVLGQILAAASRSLAVIGSGTPGGTRMLHHKAEEIGGFRFSFHRPDASVPKDRISAAIARCGPIPPHEIPSLEWLTYATDVFLDYVEPVLAPDVTILWYCEPDNSYHFKGIGSGPNLDALRRADQEFGRILDWRAGSSIGDRLQIMTLSDHGQLTVDGSAVDVAAGLTAAGFTVGATPTGSADVSIALDSAGGLYVRQSDPDLIDAIVAWLQVQPWCGPLFTRDGRQTLRLADIGMDHPRAPDIGVVMRSEDRKNDAGHAGVTRHDSRYPEGGGLHGGLHPIELSNWLAFHGDAFLGGAVSDSPAGIVDVLPTLLHVLGLDAPDTVQGRVLHEALVDGQNLVQPAASDTTRTAEGETGYLTTLRFSEVGATRYLQGARAH